MNSNKMDNQNIQLKIAVTKWWADKRLKYNLGLVIAGILAFICYVIAVEILIMSYNDNFEITLFTTAFQGIGYLLMILIANLFYNLGCWADKKYNKQNTEKFRRRLFNLGFWFSCGLPFVIPLLIVADFLVNFKNGY